MGTFCRRLASMGVLLGLLWMGCACLLTPAIPFAGAAPAPAPAASAGGDRFVNPPDTPPVAVDDNYTVSSDVAGMATTIMAADGLLRNDADANTAIAGLTATLGTTMPTRGTVTVSANGAFTYTPNTGAFGADTFTYTLSDGTNTSTGTVRINVTRTNVAPSVSLPTSVPQVVGGTTRVFSAANTNAITVADVDAGAGAITVTVSVPTGQGALAPGGTTAGVTVTGSGTNSLTLVGPLANVNAALDGLTYSTTGITMTQMVTLSVNVNDGGNTGTGGAKTGTGSVTFQVFINQAPIANADSYSGAIGNTLFAVGQTPSGMGPFTTATGNVLSNDSDPDAGDTITLVTTGTITSANGGTVTLAADGTFTYISAPGYTGMDTFQYTIRDSYMATANGTVTVPTTQTVWYINNASVAATSEGRSTAPFKSVADYNAKTATDDPGDIIFLYAGSGAYSGGITLKNTQQLLGEGVGLTVGANTLVAAGSRPTLGNSGGFAVTAAQGNTVRGFNIGNGSQGGITGSGVGTLTANNMDISTTGTAFNIAGTGNTLAVSLGTVSATGGANGIAITNAAGSFATTGGTISGTTGAGIALDGGAADVTHAGTVSVTAGRPLSVANKTGGTVAITGLVSSNGGNGVSITGNSATTTVNLNGGATLSTGANTAFAVTGGGTVTVANAGAGVTTSTGTGLDITAGSGNVTFGPAISTTGAGRSVNVGSRTGGTVAVNGGVTSTGGTGTGIGLTTNTGATISFTGTINLNTGDDPAFAATGGGTVTATDTGSTLTTTTATALNVANTTIGAGGLKFRSISAGTAASGPASGIVLNATGGSGGLTVGGNGAAGTGGTIRNGATGISLTNTASVSLSYMQLNDFTDFAIRGDTVNGFALANTTISGTNGDTAATFDGSVRFTGLTGSASVTNCNISGGYTDNFFVSNSSGTLNRLTISGTTFGANSTNFGNDAVTVEALGTATVNVTIQNSTFTASRGDHIQTSGGGSSAMDVVLTGNTLSNNHPNPVAGGGGTVNVTTGATNSTSTLTFNITNNTMRDARGTALFVAANGGTSTASGSITGNTVGVAGVADSGSKEGSGIQVLIAENAKLTATVSNNQVRQYNNHGIYMQAGGSADDGGDAAIDLDVTVQGNTIAEPGTLNGLKIGIHLNGGTQATAKYLIRLVIGGAGSLANSVAGSGEDSSPATGLAADIRLRQRQATTVRLVGYTGANNDNAAVQAFLAANNGGNGMPSTLASNTVPTGGGFVNGP